MRFKAICIGFAAQIVADAMGVFTSGALDNISDESMGHATDSANEFREANSASMDKAWDDVTGKLLRPELAKQARRE